MSDLVQHNVRSILLQYLIPELADMVLSYCWSENDDVQDAIFNGKYERLLTIIERPVLERQQSFFWACKTGYINMIRFFMDKYKEEPEFWGKKRFLNYGLCGACSGGHAKIAKSMIELGAYDFARALYYTGANNPEIAELLSEYW